MKSKRVNSHNSLFVIIIAFSAILIYAQSISFGYNVDDNLVTESDPYVAKGVGGIWDILTTPYVVDEEQTYGYRPVAKITFALEHQFFGFNPSISHFINVLLYALLCVLLFKVFKIIFPYNQWFWFLVTMLFVVHPLHVEVVASLKNREEILSFLFVLLSLKKFIDFNKHQNFIKHFLPGLIWFFLALLTKLSAIYGIVLIPLTIYYLYEKRAEEPSSIHPDFSLLNEFKNPFISLFVLSHTIFVVLDKIPNMVIYGFVINTITPFALFAANYYKHSRQNEVSAKKIIAPNAIAVVLLWIAQTFFFDTLLRHPIQILIFATPALIFLYKHNYLSWFTEWSRSIVKSKILGFIGLIALLSALLIVGFYLPKVILPEEQTVLRGSQNPLFVSEVFLDKLTLGFYTLGYYLKLFFIPHPLVFYYGQFLITQPGVGNPMVWFGLISNLIIGGYVVLNVNKKDFLAYLGLFYLASIFLFSNLYVPVTGIIGERLAFVASWPLSCFSVWLMFKLLKISFKKEETKFSLAKLLMSFGLIIAPLIAKTSLRLPDWKDRDSLFSKDIITASPSVKVNTLYAAHMYEKAFENADKPISNKYFDLALKHFKKVAELEPTNYNAWNNIGTIEFNAMRRDENAALAFERALSLNPNVQTVIFNLAAVYKELNRINKADSLFQRYFLSNPSRSDKLLDYSNWLLEREDYEKAIAINKAVAELGNDYALIFASQIYVYLNDYTKAKQFLEIALERNPNNKEALNYLNLLIKNENPV